MLRRWILGTLTALLGIFGLVQGASSSAWLVASGGAALLAASLVHLARPTRKTLGAIEVAWGAMILIHALGAGLPPAAEGTELEGQPQGLVFGGLLILAGLVNLVRPAPSATESVE